MIQFTIPICPVTKKNSQRLIKCGRFHKIAPSKKYAEYEKKVEAFIPRQHDMIDYPVEVRALFFMETRRRVDLTNLLEALDDILVKYGVLKDDNFNIVASHDGSRVLHDKARPRTEVTIRLLGDEA